MARRNLSESASKALAALLELGPSSRPALSQATGLSKQTISLAISELEDHRLVEVVTSQQGHTGRSASVYDLASDAGWLLGVDLGSTHLRLAATTLRGRLLVETEVSVPALSQSANTDLSQFAGDPIDAFITKTEAEHGRVQAAGVALSRAVPALTDWQAAGIDDHGDLASIAARLGIPGDVPLYLENNVNCAALGELRHGRATRHSDFAYLQIGVGIGAGIVTRGSLLRGEKGEAGELRRLPSPFTDGPEFADAEDALSVSGILARYAARAGTDSGISVKEVFRNVETDPVAAEVVRAEARGIAYLAVVLAAVADPGAIVLGGGVGQNAILLPVIEQEVRRRGLDIDITVGSLGDSATLAGATALAAELTLGALLGEAHAPRALLGYGGPWPT
ncbi:ROK family transcriptional regulator [Actinoallomurus soli]|uniref:ROK family transcriptional regulator n=1 Tax=Actinoallomurus soli TaxID=2952535 RepID=UPI002092C315|nr:ROK family transcriptional regulator [Actinoallomurus soli]MCO5969410.1 ROK family protein [Actinoallomurus soli]